MRPLLLGLLAITVLISITIRPEPMAPAPVPTCAAESNALVALLNERRVGLGDGSYATCRVHHLPKGEHVHETL